jgi:hypothetical protein
LITQFSQDYRLIDVGGKQEMVRTLKVEITIEEDDGRVIVKTISGEDADKWQRLIAELCLFAQVHNKNPDWASLQWRKTEESRVTSQTD